MSMAMQEGINLVTQGLEKLVASIYEENTEGGHARGVVHEVAKQVGIDLADGPDGMWGVQSMSRVIAEVYRLKRDCIELTYEVARLKGVPYGVVAISRTA